jgi:hypothetical protein
VLSGLGQTAQRAPCLAGGGCPSRQYYCGASHAELWRIQYSYDEIQALDGQTILVPRAPLVTVNAVVSVCVDAVTYPIARAFVLLGRGASSAALQRLVRPIRSALTLT